ncbi:hypothetical protein [Leeuwenhoekiella sp. MAR_2009_132]|uniref:hypothetical protein n=1 Tax=Leeuwenhoekiella sp. MAR_2009_132 TaxID=1392489 RepID=UPI00048E57AD|nr:hypothetical protein [Leeuwenhoekiella sp. MAR_2009_132]
MGKGNKFKSRSKASLNRKSKTLETRDNKRETFIVLSFRDFDINQGQDFEEWEEAKLLALMINKLRAICQITMAQATAQQIIKPYTKVDFPPESAFTHPKHVLPDVTWCTMHIQGKECIIGHIEDNIFHIVFLDKEHEFWKTKKKNT